MTQPQQPTNRCLHIKNLLPCFPRFFILHSLTHFDKNVISRDTSCGHHHPWILSLFSVSVSTDLPVSSSTSSQAMVTGKGTSVVVVVANAIAAECVVDIPR